MLMAAGWAAGTLALLAANRRAVRGWGVGRLWGDATAVVVVTLGYGVLLCLTGRLATSLALGLGLIALLAAGNALKTRMLGEPLVFSDVFLAGHALRWPRLYFGYVPVWVWIVIAVGVAGLVAAAAQEPAMGADDIVAAYGVLAAGVVMAAVGMLMLSWSARSILAQYPLSWDANRDAKRYTALGAAVLHTLSHITNGRTTAEAFQWSPNETPPKGKAAGHLVLVQAESFAPIAERLGRLSVTPTIDHLMAEGCSGALDLAWRGAYTMRTEFSVMTGTATTATRSWAFDPYRLAERVPLASLARDLKAAGYETVVWHPNDGRFFNRHAVMAHLGFDRFLSGADFADLPRAGAATSDEALLATAARFLKSCTKPTFLFIITMEGHGPWGGRNAQEELSCYEAHLASLDRGVEKLAAAVKALPQAHLALYGDHIPGLKALSKTKETATAWLLWPAGKACEEALPPEALRRVIRQEVLA